MTDLNQFMKDATEKGLYLANADNITELVQEYQKTTSTADKLCEEVDPEATPFDSKYKARDLLDQLTRKLEATRTIAFVDYKRDTIRELDWRIASIRVRQGVIAWEVEEPHNAQTELELAAEFYCVGFIDSISAMTKDENENEESTKTDTKENTTAEKVTIEESSLVPPAVPRNDELSGDMLRCLNMLGILWAGRGYVKKSFLYLLAAKKVFEEQETDSFIGLEKNARLNGVSLEKLRADFDSQYTHTLFYLAQAYGHIGNSVKSSFYCRETLQRQLDSGLNDPKTALEWVKNCSGIADFYMSMQKFKNCAAALASAEHILKEKVLNVIQEERLMATSSASSKSSDAATSGKISNVSEVDAQEMVGDLHRRWARMDVSLLKRAFDQQSENRRMIEMGLPDSLLNEDEEEEEENVGEETSSTSTTSSVFSFGASSAASASPSSKSSNMRKVAQSSLFRGLAVADVRYLGKREIDTFEAARSVFLRSASRIEAAKRIFLLDGWVSDHCSLLQDHSKLYHYLSIFENDNKRKLAMESRRIELLLPLLNSLSKTSFEVLHKQISYELGEIYLACHEIKLFKLRGRNNGEIDVSSLKKAEITKCNNYCRGALAMFTHFCTFYSKSPVRTQYAIKSSPFETMTIDQIVDVVTMDPDESVISEEEIRPYLNAHFLSCRALSKVISPPQSIPSIRVQYLVAAMKRYEWLADFAVALCNRKGVDISVVFGEEAYICDDMRKLLPSKIDRMHYLGEGGLTL